MAIEGSLETCQVPEILQMISAQRKTGILTVQGEADIVTISFKDGHVVAADALNQTGEGGGGAGRHPPRGERPPPSRPRWRPTSSPSRSRTATWWRPTP